MMSSPDPSTPSLTSVLVLHSSCHEKDATAGIAAFESAWRQLVASSKLSCDMILIPDMAVEQHQQQQHNEVDTHQTVVKFRNELLDPCGTYNVFSLSNLVANSYILSLTDCRLRPIIATMPSSIDSSSTSSEILLPALPVPSTFHFTWNVSEVFQADADASANVNTNAYAEIRVDLDVTKAKRQFRKVWQHKESTKMIKSATTAETTTATNVTVAEEQKEEEELEEEEEVGYHHERHHSTTTETKQVPPAPVDNESHSHVPVVNWPSCPVWEMPQLPPTRTGSIAHDPRLMHLETLMESELNDINRILSFLAVTGLVLFVSFLWTAFVHVSHTQLHSRSRASHTPQKTPGTRSSKYKQQQKLISSRTVPMESISMQAVSSGAGAGPGNLSPLSLDTILAAQGNCHGPSPSSPSALVFPLRQGKAARMEETPTSAITYGPKQRSSRRSRQTTPLVVVPNQDNNNNQDNRNEADPSLSPCSKLAQQWSRDKSARRNLRRDGASRGVEASSVVAEGLATSTATTTTTTTTAATETKFQLPPVQVKPVRGGIGIDGIDIVAAPAASVPFYGKSNDSFGATGHAVPAPVQVPNALPSITTCSTTENARNAATSIRIPEEYGLQQLLLSATVTPGPTPRLRPAPSTVDPNHDSSFVHEYWGARAM